MINGLKIIRTIQSTDRFDAYEADYQGRKVFAKEAKTDKTKELLAGLARNSDMVNHFGDKREFKFRAPEIYVLNKDWIVTEWISGGSIDAAVEEHPQSVADILADFMLVFDKETVKKREGFRHIFTKEGLAERMSERLPSTLEAGEMAILTEARQRFDELQKTLVPRWQDADIKPDHIFKDPINTRGYVLVDSEHLSHQWPRFFDLANNFVKFWIRDQKPFSVNLVETFLDKSGIPKGAVFNQFMASVIVRGIALHWEIDYDPGAKSYNIPRAQDLLHRVIEAHNMDDLLY